MIERIGTWAEVDIGTTLLTRTGLPVIVVGKERGWIRIEDRNHHKTSVPPKPADDPVTILEMTEAEALDEVRLQLGAYRYLDFETEARMEKRAPQWLVPPFPRKGQPNALADARNHVDWYHGTYAGDAQAYGGFKTLTQITAAHEEMHESAFMDRPHQHREEG